MTRYRQAFDDLVVELTEQLLSTPQIAEGLGVHQSTVTRARVRTGVVAPLGRKPVDAEPIIWLTKRGWSIPRIANHLGISERTVQRTRAKAGLCRPPNTPITVEQIARAGNLLDDGASYSEVARTIGCCWETVAKYWPGRSWSQRQVLEFMWINQRKVAR